MAKGQQKRNWKELDRRWLSGEFSDLTDMSQKLAIPYDTLWKHSKKRAWRKIEEKVAEKEVEAAVALRAKELERRRRTYVSVGDLLLNRSIRTLTKVENVDGKTVVAEFSDASTALSAARVAIEMHREGFAQDEDRRPVINQNTIIYNEAARLFGEASPGLKERVRQAFRAGAKADRR